MTTTQHELETQDGRDAFDSEVARLSYRSQHSVHGAGQRSVQVFDADGTLVRDIAVEGPVSVADLRLERWLNASNAELRSARTCQHCGCMDADIDLGLCFACFSAQKKQTQYSQVAAVLGKYGYTECQREYEQRGRDASDDDD